MTWYKVVQPNLASFADDTFKYRIGAARLAPKSDRRVLCEPGLLHASPSAPEAARYGRWPYRLLEVDPEGAEPVARKDDKAGFLRLKVVRELPVSECFGPNGAAVLRLVQRAEQLTKDEVDQWDAAWAAARDAAWALVVADQIGQHGFTQAHFDLLTEPWREVIGATWEDS